MVFSSTVFLFLFLPLVLLFYYNPFCKSRIYRNIILLLFSLVFYAWGEPIFVFVMIFSIFINWIFCIQMEKYQKYRKVFMIAAVVYDIGLLFLYKYATFVADNFNLLFHKEKWELSIVLPIGISFFTFQMLSYVWDVYYQKVPVQKNFLNVGLYICMFPQLIAGPIVRYETVSEEIMNRQENWFNVQKGLFRFIVGLGKKVLLANYLGLIADNIFSMVGDVGVSVATAWLGIIAYSMQIFFDFSAYSDMAIGLGLVFGFHFNENFNYPYISASVTEFWRRWHISLSSWFRDYVYIPLGGNRVSKSRHIINLFLVWLLTGLWHGANWTFIIWGLLYFFVLVLEKEMGFQRYFGKLSHLYTLLVVGVAWVIFKSPNMADAMRYLGTMFGVHAASILDETFWEYIGQAKWILLAGFILSTPILKSFATKLEDGWKKEAMKVLGIFVLFIFVLFSLVKSTYNPFIYFNF